MSTNDTARRGFLRNLAALPLVGGSVTLLGQPTAAAEPVTRELLDAYDAWLERERGFLKFERYGAAGLHRDDLTGFDVAYVNRRTGETLDFMRAGPWSGYQAHHPAPSTRAAIVLSAVGCPWHRRERPSR